MVLGRILRASRVLFRVGELLQREGVADVVERLVAAEAFGLVDAGPVLFVGGEHGVVPVLVAQHLAPSPCRRPVCPPRRSRPRPRPACRRRRASPHTLRRTAPSRRAAACRPWPPLPRSCWRSSSAPVWSRGS